MSYFFKIGQLDVPEYRRLLEGNVTKAYKKADIKLLTKIDLEAGIIAMAMKEAFITLKDHKERFENRPVG